MEKMTLHRALSELKVIDARIQNNIDNILPSGIYQKGKLINNIYQEEDFKRNAQSRFDAVKDLISRKALIKSAVVRANSTSIIQVAGKTMTIADAINEKNVIKFKKALVTRLKQMHNQTKANFNTSVEIVKKNLQSLLEATVGKDNVKTDEAAVEAVTKPYMARNEIFIFDPLKVEETITKLEKEIEDFESEVDAALSEANAINFIEFDEPPKYKSTDSKDLPF